MRGLRPGHNALSFPVCEATRPVNDKRRSRDRADVGQATGTGIQAGQPQPEHRATRVLKAIPGPQRGAA